MFSLQNLSFKLKGQVLVGVPLLISMIILTGLYIRLLEAEQRATQQAHARRVMSLINHVTMSTSSAVSAMSKYAIRYEPADRKRYEDAVRDVVDSAATLEQEEKGSVHRLDELRRIRKLYERVFEILNYVKTVTDSGEDRPALYTLGSLRAMAEGLTREMMDKSEAYSAESRAEVGELADDRFREQVKILLLAAVAANVVIAILLGILFNRSILSRLNVLMQNTVRMSSDQVLISPVVGSDEIAVLDKMFHRMNHALTLARQKERAVVDNAVDVIFSLDPNCIFVAVNPAAYKLWGYDSPELVGKNVAEILQGQHADDSLSRICRAREDGVETSFETTVTCKSGQQVYMLWTAQWSESEAIFCCVAHDVTEMKIAQDRLRASEARVRLIIESMPLGLLLINSEGLIQLCNYSIERMSGYSAEELMGKDFHLVIPSLELDRAVSTAGGSIPQQNQEYELLLKAGEQVPIEVSVSAFSYGGSSHLIIASDITERRKVEQLKQDFTNMVSHDLRSPLTSIQGALALIGEGVFGPLSQDGLGIVSRTENEIERLIGLVNDLLDLEKFHSGRMNLDYGIVNINDITARAIAAVRYLAENKAITVETQLSEQCSTVAADGRRLIQVFINLLSNAIKFSPVSGSVVVAAEVVGSQSVVFKVIDEGPGIDSANRHAIFDKFFQVNDGVSKHIGSGLGLSICKAIVEAHGGSIGVDANPAKGSTFWFQIPCTAAVFETMYHHAAK